MPGIQGEYKLSELTRFHFHTERETQTKSIVLLGLGPPSTVRSSANIWTAAAFLLANALEFH